MRRYRTVTNAAAIAAVLGALGLVPSCAKHEAPLIPRQVLFQNPDRRYPQISPDGRMLAYLAPSNGVLNVWLRSLGAEDDRAVTMSTQRDIKIVLWSSDSRHLLYLQDTDGDGNYHLFDIPIETGAVRDRTPYEGVAARVHYPRAGNGETVLVEMNRSNQNLFDIYRLDLATGGAELVAKNPGNIVEWMGDARCNVRGATAANDDGSIDLLVRDSEASPWRILLTWEEEDALTSHPLYFNGAGTFLYCVDSRNANTSRLVRVDVATGDTTVIAGDPHCDVRSSIYGPDGEAQAVEIMRERSEWVIVDDRVRPDFEVLRSTDEGDLYYNSGDDADSTWIVAYVKDAAPNPYYVYDRRSRKASFLFNHREDLKKYDLSPMEPMSYAARDGLTIHGYITYPLGDRRTNLPLVLFVHGGPWSRDFWTYHPEVQWLANRGYVCLQVNFRGSMGYGKAFLNAGNKEWGGAMQNDLTDAVHWAIDRGIANPKRIAIYGGSYGGYAALCGVAFTPDLYRCAVSLVGPTNLVSWINSVPPSWVPMRESLYRRIGNPETEAEFLRSRSPYFSVGRIRAPLLIAQGANDPRVPKSDSDAFVAALRARGVPVEYLVYPDEGHGFARPVNRFAFFAAAERFLAEQLGGRSEEAPAR